MVSVLFGLAALVAIGWLVREATGRTGLAILAALLAGFTDPQIKTTSLEILDHNGLALALFALAMLVAARLMREESRTTQRTVTLGCLLALLWWSWPGSAIYAAPIGAALLFQGWSGRDRRLLRASAAAFALAGLLVVPLAVLNHWAGGGWISFEYVSAFSVLLQLAGALALLLAESLLALRDGAPRGRAVATSVVAGLALAAIAVVVAAPLAKGARFAGADDAWLATVAESKPLFLLTRGSLSVFTTSKGVAKFGYLVFVFPVALALLLARRLPAPREVRTLVGIGGLFFALLALAQQKFAADASLFHGILLALLAGWILDRLGTRAPRAAVAGLAVVLVAALLPLAHSLREPYAPFSTFARSWSWLERDARPGDTSPGSTENPRTGAMVPWDLGHHVERYARVPSVADNFGPVFVVPNPSRGFGDMARFFLGEDENEALALLRRYRCDYVVVTPSSIFEQTAPIAGLDPKLYHDLSVVEEEGSPHISARPTPRFLRTIGFRLGDAYGSANPSEDPSDLEVPALRHFRLVHESPEGESAGRPVPAGDLKIYRVVDGTPLPVPLPGDTPYALEARVVTNAGSRFVYRQKGLVKEGVLAPYPTRRVGDEPYAEGYRVTAGGRVFEFADVR